MFFNEYSLLILTYIFIVYLLCGIIKGTIGFGMPTVSISLLVFFIDIKLIIALILIPTIVVNIYQLSIGGNLIKILRETKFFLLFSTIFIFPGTYLLNIISSQYIILFIAFILFINSILFLANKIYILPNYESPFTQITIGAINGVIIGMTSIYTMPLIFLLQSFKYNKNTTVQFLGIAFFLYPIAQIFSFANFNLISLEIIKTSSILLIPIFFGLYVGQKIRKRISETLFQKFFYCTLLAMSIIISISLI